MSTFLNILQWSNSSSVREVFSTDHLIPHIFVILCSYFYWFFIFLYMIMNYRHMRYIWNYRISNEKSTKFQIPETKKFFEFREVSMFRRFNPFLIKSIQNSIEGTILISCYCTHKRFFTLNHVSVYFFSLSNWDKGETYNRTLSFRCV